LTSAEDNLIPFSTLARIEQGRLDPGLRRLHSLLQLYGLPIQAAGDLLDIESIADASPDEQDPLKLRDIAKTAWQAGDTRRALACFFAVRRLTAGDPALKKLRQDSVLASAVLAGKLGKHHLSRQMLDELLTERPDPALLVGIMVQQSSSWKSLGAPEAALAYLARADQLLKPAAHLERGWVCHQRASVQIDLGDFQGAQANMKKAIAAFREAGRPYDEGMSLAALARLFVEMGEPKKATLAARRAVDFATTRKFARIRMLASIQHARAHLIAKAEEPALIILRAVLADAVTASDNVGRFYAHFYLWKAYSALGAVSRAENECRDAGFYLQFMDEASQEAIELRGLSR
jgi:tetratricopeptide (TPR) repeat protein